MPERDRPQEAGQAAEDREPRSETHREVKYLRYLIDRMVPVAVKVRGGETFRGVIEYYDSRFIRLTRKDAPNLFIFKKDIHYLYEESASKPSP